MKAPREKRHIPYKGSSTRLLANFSPETLKAKKKYAYIFKVPKSRTVNQEFYNHITAPSKIKVEIKTCPDKQKMEKVCYH